MQYYQKAFTYLILTYIYSGIRIALSFISSFHLLKMFLCCFNSIPIKFVLIISMVKTIYQRQGSRAKFFPNTCASRNNLWLCVPTMISWESIYKNVHFFLLQLEWTLLCFNKANKHLNQSSSGSQLNSINKNDTFLRWIFWFTNVRCVHQFFWWYEKCFNVCKHYFSNIIYYSMRN